MQGAVGLAVLAASGAGWLLYQATQHQMTCHQVQDALRQWAKLDSKTKEQTVDHVQVCAKCRQVMEQLGIQASA